MTSDQEPMARPSPLSINDLRENGRRASEQGLAAKEEGFVTSSLSSSAHLTLSPHRLEDDANAVLEPSALVPDDRVDHTRVEVSALDASHRPSEQDEGVEAAHDDLRRAAVGRHGLEDEGRERRALGERPRGL